MEIEWSEPAESDLGDIYEYIARDVPLYAEQFVDQVLATTNLLTDQPLMGRCVPEAHREDIRELLFQSYRIIYQVKPEFVYIVAVIHGSRDLSKMDNKPWEVV
ncbi:MAG: plasmid stabilization protein [Proteobacteria bacterium]|nr:MAG: plasmid stabilization protein [Pseudomonadota bacterium]